MNDNDIVKRFVEYFCNNYVKDFIPDTAKTLLIFESPHTLELENNIPLAGSAGKVALKCLGINDKVGLGTYLCLNKIPSIGIMNVCKAPLQKTQSDKQSDFDYAKLKIIQTGYKRIFSHRDEAVNEIEKIILNDFKERLQKYFLKNHLTNIICCGNFALKYYCVSGLNFEEVILETLPHPARNGWYRCTEEQKKILVKLKNIIMNQ